MAPSLSITEVDVESHVFTPSVNPPGSDGVFFLGGAGVRGLEIEGKFVKFTAIGVYLEESAIPSLAVKWKGKTAEELMDSDDFFTDILTGPFEKFIRVAFISPLTGKDFTRKVAENCVALMKAAGNYNDAESKAVQKLRDIFKNESFLPGASIFFTQSPLGSFTIRFSKDSKIPEASNGVIENKPLSEAYLESVIGKDGVSPASRKSLAVRLSNLFQN